MDEIRNSILRGTFVGLPEFIKYSHVKRRVEFLTKSKFLLDHQRDTNRAVE